MKHTSLNAALVMASVLSLSGSALAKGSGGGHGSGGHGSGGHGSSGHASSGHASSGHGNSGGRTSSAGARGSARSSAPRSGAAPSTARPSAVAVAPSPGHRPHDGPIVGPAVPRAVTPFVALPLPSLGLFNYSRFGVGHGGLGVLFDPFSRGYGFGYTGYGYDYGYGAAPVYGGFASALDPFDRTGPTGSIRLDVEARDAEVYVDGYYAGIVDDFDGHFQHLDLTPGPHHIEISGPGYQPLTFDVVIQPHHKIEYRRAVTRLRP